MLNLLIAWMEALTDRMLRVAQPLVEKAQAGVSAIMIRGPPILADQRGAIDIGGIMMMGIAMVFLAIGFIMFPISTTATQTLLDYAYSANASITDATYTGFTALLGITPLLILIGYVSAAVITGFLGLKIMRGAEGKASLNPGNLLMLGLSIVFIAIGLIVEPVMLDGISSVVHGGGSGISSSFTGLSAIILVVPMLVHISFLAAAVITGFFGIKSISETATA